jgi:hypothetical protein
MSQCLNVSVGQPAFFYILTALNHSNAGLMHLNVGENLTMDYKPKAVYDVVRCVEGN